MKENTIYRIKPDGFYGELFCPGSFIIFQSTCWRRRQSGCTVWAMKKWGCGASPKELRLSRFFRGDRGKYRELSRKARMDSLAKTLDFVSQW